VTRLKPILPVLPREIPMMIGIMSRSLEDLVIILKMLCRKLKLLKNILMRKNYPKLILWIKRLINA